MPHLPKIKYSPTANLSDSVLIRYYQLQEYKPGAGIVVVYGFLLQKISLDINNSEYHFKFKLKKSYSTIVALTMTTSTFLCNILN